MTKITTLVVFVALMLGQCSSQTLVRTTDKDAKIYIDGEYRGKGAIIHRDTKIIGSTTHVQIKKNGCEPVYHSFARDERFSFGACVGGALFMVPWLWIMKYKPERTYEYECQPTAVPRREPKK